MKKKSDKERLFEVMGRLDKTFKPKLNEETFRDKNFKFHEGDEVTFTDKSGNQIDGIISDYDYHMMTWEKTYEIEYMKDGRTWTAIGVPEDRITLKQVGSEDEYTKRYNQNKMIRKMSGELEEEEEISIEPQEHGPESPNYKAKLEHIVDHAQKIYEGLPEGEIPHWVQDKITIADDYLDAIYSWMHGEEEEKEGDIEGAEREMDSEENLSEGIEIGVGGYEYGENPQTVLDLSHTLGDVIFKSIWDKIPPEQKEQTRGSQMVAPDGTDVFKPEGVVNFYVNGVPEELIEPALAAAKQKMDSLGIKYGEIKKEPSGSFAGNVVRIPVQIPERDTAPSFHVTYSTAKQLLNGIGLPMEADDYWVDLPVDDVLQAIQKAEQEGNTGYRGFNELKRVATWAKNNGYKTVGGA